MVRSARGCRARADDDPDAGARCPGASGEGLTNRGRRAAGRHLPVSGCGRCLYCRQGSYGQCLARLRAAKDLGADAVAGPADAAALVADLTGGLGADVVMEAVGVPESFELCARMLRPGGRLAIIGVHGKPATLHLEDLWARNVTIRTGLVDTYSTPTLLRLLVDGRLPVSELVTHSFELGLMEEAYDVFANAADTGALKVVLGSPSHDELRLAGAGRADRTR